MRRSSFCDCTTTSAVITLVMLAIGRGLYCRRPHSCLPVVAFASSAACAAMGRGGWRKAVAALADPSAHVPVTETNAMPAATIRAPRSRRDRAMGRLRKAGKAGGRCAGEFGTMLTMVLPSGGQRHPFRVASGALRSDDGELMQLGEVAGAGVRARAAQPGDDRVDQVLYPGTQRVQVHPRAGDALVEQLLTGALERRVGRGPQPDCPGRCHAEALFVELALRVTVDIPRRLVGACEPGADHRARRPGGERQGDIPWIPDTAVRPDVPAELASFGSAV